MGRYGQVNRQETGRELNGKQISRVEHFWVSTLLPSRFPGRYVPAQIERTARPVRINWKP